MFRRVFRFLTRGWVLALIGVIAVALLIWFAGPLIAVAEYRPLASPTVRVVTILVLLLLWGLNNLRGRASEKADNDALSKDLADNAETAQQDEQRNAEADAEQEILAERLKSALGTLQTARLSRGRRLYELPWYVLIGAPGSGKTTMLRQSGLHFPLESQIGDNAVQGAGGTRYCDWWFTDEAVFLDTAGRYTAQDEPRGIEGEAWRGFLGMLRRSRPKRPLNGVIVTVSLLDVVRQTPTQQSLHTAAIKRRIQELNSHLGMELPVYVVFTKCDRVAGFEPFFADLDEEQREQPLGLTFPFRRGRKPGEDRLEEFRHRFRALIERVDGGVLARLNTEHNPGRRRLIHEFPQQMLGLTEPLAGFLGEIFAANRFEQPALLRGVYFISGTQDSGAAQWVTGVLPPELFAPADTARSGGSPRGYFISRLLRGVVLPESGLAAADIRAERRFRWLRAGLAVSVVLAFAGSAVAWSLSYHGNRAELAEAQEAIEAAAEPLERSAEAGARDWAALARGLDAVRELPWGVEQAASDRPLRLRFGLFQGQRIGAQAEQTYRQALERIFLPRLDVLLRDATDPGPEDEAQLYEALRFYLMLYHREHLLEDEFLEWAALLWREALPGERHAGTRESLARHAEVALNAELPPPPMDEELVADARERLAEASLDGRVYRRIKNDIIANDSREFTVGLVLGNTAPALFQRASDADLDDGVPWLFSYQGFHQEFSSRSRRVARQLADERWIYGDDGAEALSDEDLDGLVERVRQHYFDDYQRYWRDYLRDLRVKRFDSAADGRVVMRKLASGDEPVRALLDAVSEHTDLAKLPEGAEQAGELADTASEELAGNQRRRLERFVPDGVGGPDVELPGAEITHAFSGFNDYVTDEEGLPLDRLLEALDVLAEYFEEMEYADDPLEEAFVASQGRGDGGNAMADLRRALADAPPEVRAWLEDVLDDARAVTRGGAREHVQTAWRDDVLPFYRRNIAGRYPVAPESDREVRIDDFAEFFGAGGVLDSFREDYLEPFTNSGGTAWLRPIGLSNRTLSFFRRVEDIQRAYFDGGSEPSVSFLVRPHELDRAVNRALLQVEEEEISYQHGPVRTTRVEWTGDAEGGARVVFNLVSRGSPLTRRESGSWGLFRLLDQYASQQPMDNGDGALVTFNNRGLEGSFELLWESANHPFRRKLWTNFHVPDTL